MNHKTEYGYDSIGRLATERYSEGDTAVWSASYSFDDFDNRTTKVYNDLVSSTQTTTQYAYDLANRLTGETVSGSEGYAYTYNYDDSGNLLSKVKNQNNTETVEIQNTYDAFNRMVQTAISSSGNVTYRYDSSGHRISKTSAGVVTNHIWDGDNIISDLTANKPVQNYIYGASGIEAIALSGTGGQHTVSAYLKTRMAMWWEFVPWAIPAISNINTIRTATSFWIRPVLKTHSDIPASILTVKPDIITCGLGIMILSLGGSHRRTPTTENPPIRQP